jgi:ribonuclease HI
LEKAYDTSWKYGILSDLFKAGLRGNLPIFIAKFLENRTFQVRVGATYSDSFVQEAGVPQGSILSVTLFNLKINGIVNCIRPGVDSGLYVDDFIACSRSKQMRSVERQLQICLTNLQNWSNENGFKFSETKTICVHFCNKRIVHPDPVLLLNNKPIPVMTEAKYLGIIFDRKLSFIPHLQYLRTKCLKALNLLKVVAHRDWGGDCNTLLKLYRCFVRSKLDYGSVVYGSARKSYTQMLDPIQNQALRLCLGAFRTSPVESLQIEANEPPLALRRKQLSVLYSLRLQCNPLNPAHDCLMDSLHLGIFQRKPNAIPPFGIRISNQIDNINLDLSVIAETRMPNEAPWLMNRPIINFSLHSGKKSLTDTNISKADFDVYLSENQESVHLYTDGSKEGENVAAAAVCGDWVTSLRLPQNASIFTAEACALNLALEYIETSQQSKFIIFSDSMSCLQALNNFKIQNTQILDILEKYNYLTNMKKDVKFCWLPSHVGIPGNEKADIAAKAGLQLPYTASVKIPFSDLKQKVKLYYKDIWQNFWNQTLFNKLKPIKANIGETVLYNVSKRHDEVVLHRARIGHTYLTHSYLLKREEQPECVCTSPLTVEHVLLNCNNYSQIRKKYYSVASLSELFSTVHPAKIIKFVKEINLFNKF